MRIRVTRLTITILMATCFAAPSLAADDVSVKKDLFTVITLQGLPCGEVVSVTTKGEQRPHGVLQGREPLPRLPQCPGTRGRGETVEFRFHDGEGDGAHGPPVTAN